MARRPARRPRPDRYTAQATAEAQVRFGPEDSALQNLLGEARASLSSGLQAEEGAAQGITQALRMAAPEMKAIYSEAGRTQEQARADLNADLKKLKGDDVDRFKAASAREFAGAERRLSMGALGAQKELADRQVQAQMGRAYGVQKHLGEYAEQAAKVTGRQSELARERGTFTAATRGTMVENAAKRNVQRRGQTLQNRRAAADRRARTQSQRADRAIRRQSEARQSAAQQETARHNRAAEANSARSGSRSGGRGGSGGKSAFTPVQRRGAMEAFEKAVARARPRVKDPRQGPQEVGLMTQAGVPKALAHAAIQTVVHGGVGPDVYRSVYRRYGIRLKRFNRPNEGLRPAPRSPSNYRGPH